MLVIEKSFDSERLENCLTRKLHEIELPSLFHTVVSFHCYLAVPHPTVRKTESQREKMWQALGPNHLLTCKENRVRKNIAFPLILRQQVWFETKWLPKGVVLLDMALLE